MLYLIFQIGAERYALATSQVAEVLPLVEIRPLAPAMKGIAGLFSYHGVPVPVVDLCALAAGRPARSRMSTRIILVRDPETAGEPFLGLLGEKTTETIRREEADFAETGIRNEEALFLGPVTHDARGLIQRLELRQLLPEPVRRALYRAAAGAAAVGITTKS